MQCSSRNDTLFNLQVSSQYLEKVLEEPVVCGVCYNPPLTSSYSDANLLIIVENKLLYLLYIYNTSPWRMAGLEWKERRLARGSFSH